MLRDDQLCGHLDLYTHSFYPFYYCVMLSFNDGRDAELGASIFGREPFQLMNYQKVFSDPSLLTAIQIQF